MAHRYKFLSAASLVFLLCYAVAPSVGENSVKTAPILSSLHPLSTRQQRQLGGTPALVDVVMYGLAGIPIYKAVELLMPLLKMRKPESKKQELGRVKQNRSKRDLAYAQQLLNLLISVEVALEKRGVTEPQCQLRATCEIHRRHSNDVHAGYFERNFIKLINDMRSEIQNPRVVPLAKYVFQYYERAAIRGEQQRDCGALYHRCPHALDYYFSRNKGIKTRN